VFGWFKSKEKDLSFSTIQPKIEDFSDPLPVFEKFTATTGIHFNQKESVTTSKLINFCRNHALFSFDELYSAFEKNGEIRKELINMLTVNETYFFRESRQIYYVADKLKESESHFRILCAPGSSGEEPYSIAIALLERKISPSHIQIVSLDINSDVIISAKEGVYSDRSLHKTSTEIQQKYFTKTAEGYRICDEVKRLVTFQTLNIFDEQLFALGKFDIVFSRNMLIYFDEPTVIRAVERLSRLAKRKETLFFFGHADFVKTPPSLLEHYEEGIKFYTIR
jgi:chemotaxis protein methyltransferase CheR